MIEFEIGWKLLAAIVFTVLVIGMILANDNRGG